MSALVISSLEYGFFESTLSDCMGIGICDESTKHKIVSCGFKVYEKLMNFLMNQIEIKEVQPFYSMFKANLYTQKADHHLDINGNIHDSYYTTIQADKEGFLFLNCLNVESLIMFLTENLKRFPEKHYVFIPVVFSSEVNNVGHFSMLTFNLITKEIFFIDPNGKSSFFDNIFYVFNSEVNNGVEPWIERYMYTDEMCIDTETLVNNMLELYIKQLNDTFGTQYKFIKRSEWNPNKYAINKNYDNTLIKSGHCMATTTMLCDYMNRTHEHPKEVFSKLSRLKEIEIIELINSYSIGMYSLISTL